MARLAAAANALLVIVALVFAAFVSVWDSRLGPPLDELARQPDRVVQPVPAVLRHEFLTERLWSFLSANLASVDRDYGSDLDPRAIREAYSAELSRRGWAIDPLFVQSSTETGWNGWCRGDMSFVLHIGGPSDATAGRFATAFQTELTSRGTGRSQACPASGRVPDAVTSLIAIGSFVVFIGAAHVVRRRNIARRDETVARDLGIGHVATYFAWVPYAVIALRPGPTLYVPDPVRLFGTAMVVAGIAFALWAMIALGRHYDLELEVHRDHQIVRAGPYRLVRHPVYLGLGIHLIGAALATGNLAVAACVLAALPVFYLRARVEERLLREHFGSAYDAYAREVGMLVPLL